MSDPQRAPYGRQKRDSWAEARRVYAGETYYGLPALKPSVYKWLVVWYFFLGGMAGALGVLIAVAETVGRGREALLVRVARAIALVNLLISPVLLILDLHTPQRFYNMFRIARRTSPLSNGTWIVTVYGGLMGLATLGQTLHERWNMAAGQRLARGLRWPNALLGALTATYTATVLSATSTPLWAAAFRQLPVLFVTSATSAATAALALVLELGGGPSRTLKRLARLALAASGAELLAVLGTERELRVRKQARLLHTRKYASVYYGGAWGLGIVVPLLLHGLEVGRGKHSRPASLLASVCTLVGGLALRAVWIFAGNDSTKEPELYFTLAQPEEGPGEPDQ